MKCLSCSHNWKRTKISEYFSLLSTCPNCGSRFVARNDSILLIYGFFRKIIQKVWYVSLWIFNSIIFCYCWSCNFTLIKVCIWFDRDSFSSKNWKTRNQEQWKKGLHLMRINVKGKMKHGFRSYSFMLSCGSSVSLVWIL